MTNISLIIQIIIALGIFNVWLVRYNRPTSWRGGSATNMKEEFSVYGLPPWFATVIGGLKLILATALIMGIWLPAVTNPAALGMAFLMLAAIAMHFKVKDPLKKSVPAFAMLILSLIVVLL